MCCGDVCGTKEPKQQGAKDMQLGRGKGTSTDINKSRTRTGHGQIMRAIGTGTAIEKGAILVRTRTDYAQKCDIA
jgi:hypothetical protein